MNKIIGFLLLTCLSFNLCWGNTEHRKIYIRKYKDIAIQEMNRTGIPASIKLAQGILESGCGNSHLCLKANNHFGIKCHNWHGPGIYKDDDAKDECFRKYKRPEESWIDHSDFLTTRSRYAFLFELPCTDYEGWAHGLKKAGYATDPQYAHRLIRIIEDEKLYQYDRPQAGQKHKRTTHTETATGKNLQDRVVYINKIPCLRVREGDSYEAISRYFNIPLKRLLSYNDKNETSLKTGTTVFLKKKKNKAPKGYTFHKTRPGETLYMISQVYGIKLSKLLQYNYMEVGDIPQPGEMIALRGYTKLF